MTVKREDGQEGPARSVTLIATPEESQAIELAATTGRPRLVLRNVRDDSKDGGEGVTLSDLRGSARNALSEDPFGPAHHTGIETPLTMPVSSNPATQPTDAASIEFYNVKIIRGGNETQVQFPTATGKDKPSTLKQSDQHEPMTHTDTKPVGN